MRAASALTVHGWHRRPMVPVWLGILAVSAMVFGACTARRSTEQPTPPPQPELRVGITPNYPPLAFTQNGALAGVEVDFAHQLGPALGMHVTLVQTPWESLIPALRDHRIDVIMSGMSITKARQQLVSFAHPYLQVGQMILMRRADRQRLRANRAIDQPAIRVGFVTGTTGETYVRAHLTRAQPRGFDSVEAGVAALRAHQIDVFVHDAPSVYRITAPPERELVGRFEPLTEEYLAWAVRKDDTALRARLDTVLAQWNRNGTLERVLGKWITIHRKSQPRSTR